MSAPPLSMSKLKPTPSDEIGLIERSSHQLRSFGKTLALGGALYMGMYAAGGVADSINESLRQSARAEAMQTIRDCRDVVLCTLGKISLSNSSRMNPQGLNRMDYKTLETIQLGDHLCKVGKSDFGYVISIGKTLYLAGRDETELQWTIDEVKKNLNAISESRTSISHAVAYADDRK